jgi:hypothetical protein
MKVEIFTLCEFAKNEPGKLTIIGAFDTFHSAALPAVMQLGAIAIRMRFDRIEEGLKRIRFNIIDADGQLIVPSLEIPLTVNFPPTASSANCGFAAIIQRIQFPRFGEYSIELAIDGRSEGSIPLFVRQLPQVQLPGAGPTA